MSTEKNTGFNVKQVAIPVLIVATIALAFFSGTLWQRVQNLEKGSSGTATGSPAPKPGIGNDKTQSGKLADFLKSAVDANSLKSCLDSGKYDARLTSDEQLAASLGVQGTPGFFVNGMFYGGAYSWDSNLSDPTTKAVIQNSSMQALAGGAKTTLNSTAATQNILKTLLSKDILKFGDGNSKNLFVVVSDPSCPYCQIASGQNQALLKSFDSTGKYIAPFLQMKQMVAAGQASLVYIYQAGHGNGEMGMKALYCANEQGKFWEAESLLMSDQGYSLMNGS